MNETRDPKRIHSNLEFFSNFDIRIQDFWADLFTKESNKINVVDLRACSLSTLGLDSAFAGVTTLRLYPLVSFRRKPESSRIKDEFNVYTIVTRLVILIF